MLYRSRLVALLVVFVVFVVLIFGAVQVGAQGTLTLEGLSSHLGRTDARVSVIETSLAPTPTRSSRPTATPLPTPRPTATVDPAVQAALDESAANEWAARALQEGRDQKGVDWRKGGWMDWYNRPKVARVFRSTMYECGFTSDYLVRLIACLNWPVYTTKRRTQRCQFATNCEVSQLPPCDFKRSTGLLWCLCLDEEDYNVTNASPQLPYETK